MAPASRKRRRTEVTGASRSSPRKRRLYELDEKVDILQKYVKWREAGQSHWDSPLKDLRKKYPKMGKNYPKSLYDKMLKYGSVESKWGGGRPAEFTEEVWDEMMRIIREHRAKQLAPSGRTIRNELIKVFQSKDVPSKATINKKKKAMTEEEIKSLSKQVRHEIREAVNWASQSPVPDVSELHHDVYADTWGDYTGTSLPRYMKPATEEDATSGEASNGS